MNQRGAGARTTLSTLPKSVAMRTKELYRRGALRAGLHGAAHPDARTHDSFVPLSGMLITASAGACKATDTKHHYSTIQISTKLLQQ
jgi:hypothetical protein